MYRAHKKSWGGAKDDAAMLEQIGYNPEIYYGDRKNIKITMPDDILVAEAYLHGKISNDEFRSGLGIDVHRLTEGES
ncbi:MAG: hypothetical protein CM1200mP3_18100 [Chloroflexota bacterium]|nr:MAG: hypothetical protein CM1200mP3_18100 [Chloroflexota bacterium]